jgi:uncharacterized protein YaiL (DUF2058 family)
VARNNARSQLSELEFVLAREKEECRRATASATEQAQQAQRHLEDKRQLRAALCEAQREATAAREEAAALTSQLTEEKRLREEEVSISYILIHTLVKYSSKFNNFVH